MANDDERSGEMTPSKLIDAAANRRAVWDPSGRVGWARKPRPAAFVVSMQFSRVMRVLELIEVYAPKGKRKGETT